MVKLSDFHSIELADPYLSLLETPQQKDYTLHKIYLKEVNEAPLKLAEIVIAGVETRAAIPLAAQYPVHFKKTYYPKSFFTEPKVEFEATSKAAAILGMPAPIGYEEFVFRNSFIPGKAWDRHSPFGISPEDRNFQVARDLPLTQLIGLWILLEQVYAQVKKLHAARFLHGDLETHNIIVCPSPLRPFIIDYEVAVTEFQGSEEDWQKKRLADLREILREALFIQSVLGQQEGDLSAESLERLPQLFDNPKSVLRRLKEIGVH